MIAISARDMWVYPSGRPGRYSMTLMQARVYRLIVAKADATGKMPSLRDIQMDLGCALSPVQNAINGLVERGWLVRNHQLRCNRYSLTEPVMRYCDHQYREVPFA